MGAFVCKGSSVASAVRAKGLVQGPEQLSVNGSHHNKDFLRLRYLQVDSTCPSATLEGQLCLGTGVGAARLPGPGWASGVVGRLLQALEGKLAPVGGIGARRAAGVGAVGWSRVFGRI